MDSPPTETLNDHILEDDYYSLLNVRKDATTEEITNSYRRLCLLFHPDKHTDPVKKRNAEVIFNKIKIAHGVLTDPQLRAIYDTLGTKGLETEGWQIVERTKTPQEIREEYEQLLRAKEERELQESTKPKGTISVGINASDLFESYDFEYGLPYIEISSMSISQSVDAPLDTSEKLNLNGNIGVHNGNGSGSINCSMKKTLSSKSWIEGGIGAGNGLLFHLKGYRVLSKHCFGTAQSNFHFVGTGLSPGVELMVCRQLNKSTAGYITWKAVTMSSINTTISHVRENTRFLGYIQFGFRQSFVGFKVTRHLDHKSQIAASIKFGVFGSLIEYGCEKKFSKYSTIGATMAVGIPSGVTLKIKIRRANQTFIFPILLSEDVLPSAVFYGTAAPILGWYLLKTFYVDPQNRKTKKRELEKKKEANAQRIAEKRKEASIAISLMQETYKRIKSEEERKGGLIILFSVYGSEDSVSNLSLEEIESQIDVLDVTVQLQCLVKGSKLILPDRSKCSLPGFYDPCLGEDKCLRVDYSYRNKKHSITVKDNEILKIPRLMES